MYIVLRGKELKELNDSCKFCSGPPPPPLNIPRTSPWKRQILYCLQSSALSVFFEIVSSVLEQGPSARSFPSRSVFLPIVPSQVLINYLCNSSLLIQWCCLQGVKKNGNDSLKKIYNFT